MSEYIITTKQIATILAKCHTLMQNADGTPTCNPKEIAELVDEPVTLKEIVRCKDCERVTIDQGDHDYREPLWCGLFHTDVSFDGFCAWGRKKGSE